MQALPGSCCGTHRCSVIDVTWASADMSGWFMVPDIAALYLIPANLFNKFATVGTGLAFIGQYHWSTTSVDADDSLTVINPTGNLGAGRWHKIL